MRALAAMGDAQTDFWPQSPIARPVLALNLT